MKIKLRKPYSPHNPKGIWIRSVPFFFNERGHLVHRVRSAETFEGVRHPLIHKASYWCGNTCTSRTTKAWIEIPPVDAIVCLRCEKAAVAAGEPTSEELVDRHVHVGSMRIKCHCHPELSAEVASI